MVWNNELVTLWNKAAVACVQGIVLEVLVGHNGVTEFVDSMSLPGLESGASWIEAKNVAAWDNLIDHSISSWIPVFSHSKLTYATEYFVHKIAQK